MAKNSVEYRRNIASADDDLKGARELGYWPLFGEGFASGHIAEARQALGKAAEGLIGDVGLPEFAEGGYGKYTLAGEYRPEMAGYETITEDPRLLQMEMDALDRMIESGSEVGRAKQAAAMRKGMFDGNSVAAGHEAAIRQQAERTGQAGAGMDMVMQGQSAQMGANRATQAGMDATYMAALEKLANEQALLGAAGNVRSANFRNASANADALNRFNMFNTNMANEAQRMNLGAKQNISNANVDAANKSLDRQDTNTQRTFDNSMQQAMARGNALQGMSNSVGQSAQQSAEAGRYRDENLKDIASGIFSLFGGSGK